MIYTIIISTLSVLVVILGYTTFNLLRKNEKQEDVLVSYMEYLDRLSRVIEASDKKLKEGKKNLANTKKNFTLGTKPNSSKKLSTKVKALGSIKSDGLKNMLDNL